MQPYLLKVPLQRKEPEIQFDTCQVDYVCTLSDSEFRFFQHNLMEEQDFLRDYNLHHASPPTEGVRNAVMVLSTGTDDGILVCTEGYDYARYSAYVPNARQILQLKQYPALQDYVSGMTELAERCVQKALTVGQPEEYRISLADLRSYAGNDTFNTDLFLALLNDRPELNSVELNDDWILLGICPEYLPRRDRELHILNDEEFKIACAKHLLWQYDAGGAQANFSNCEFHGTDFSAMELNSAVFDGTVFWNCRFQDASLCFASFRNCTFIGCDCRDMTAEEANFCGTVFDRCEMGNAVMTHSDLTDVVFQDCEMAQASIRNSLIKGMVMTDNDCTTLDMIGTTVDTEAWGAEAPQALSEEELQ